jgi:hypothetical protein
MFSGIPAFTYNFVHPTQVYKLRYRYRFKFKFYNLQPFDKLIFMSANFSDTCMQYGYRSLRCRKEKNADADTG